MVKSKIKFIEIFFLIFSIYLIKELNFIFYNSVDSPDFDTYSVYFEYMFNNLNSSGREQGLLYYYLNSWSFYLQNNLSVDSNLLTLLHKSIQQFNFYLFALGIFGIYRLLKFYNFSSSSILYTLIALNLLPLSISMRIVFKPEIITFALLPWIIYLFENFIISKNVKLVYLSIPLIVTVLTSKGNMAIMLIFTLLFFYFKVLFLISKKNLFLIILIFISLSAFTFYEDFKGNGLNLTQLESGSSSDKNYDYKAPVNFLYNINLYNLVSSPIKNNHADSFIAITLLDTFGDYYDIYWDNDSSLYFKNNSSILNFNQSNEIKPPKLDVKNKNLTFYLQNNTDTYYKKFIGLILSMFFYFLFARNLIKDQKFRKYYLMTIISIILLLLHAILGVPSNNFNPNLGDTLKPLYYSPFLLISAAFLFARIFEKNKNKVFIFIFLPLLFVILGFPKYVDDDYSRDISQINSYSEFCEINKRLILGNYIDEDSTCKEGIVIKQVDYDFMNVDTYQEKPRFLFVNTLLLFSNILSILIIVFSRFFKNISIK